jgi:thiol-disulfide isomerase/thioredoxin
MPNVKLLIVLLSLIFAVAARAADQPPMLPIGAAAPDFKLPGVDGKTYTLANFADAKILVILFTCNHCPTAQAYEDRIIKMYDDYHDKGVALIAINPNDATGIRLDELGYTEFSDSFPEMKQRAKDRNFKFPYLDDGQTQSTARAYGVVATPHVYIFDQARKLRYVGRIDDSDVKTVKSQDARNAIDALLAGKPVPVEKTKVFGCSTKWATKNEDVKKSLAKWDAEPVTLNTITLDGVKKLVANDDAAKKLRLVNIWATWCGPCVIELPELVEMNRMYRKRPFEMITISMDEPEKKDRALEKLKELKVATTNYLITGDRDKFMETLDPKWEGPLPHTLLIAPGGKVIYRHTGEIDPLELKKAIVGYLGRTY